MMGDAVKIDNSRGEISSNLRYYWSIDPDQLLTDLNSATNGPPETEFERGVHRFGYLLTRVMFVMFVVVLAVNMFRAKPALDSLLFALALAVGLTPELLPAIISITLAHGAQRMAKRGVIVRKLNAIENFGSMDILCTDKTGTLTEGVVILKEAIDSQGTASNDVLRFAYLNAKLQTGLNNPLDEAINSFGEKSKLDISSELKIDEIPYDFSRKRLSVIVSDTQGSRTLITKGALANVLQVCDSVQTSDGAFPLDDSRRADIDKQFRECSALATTNWWRDTSLKQSTCQSTTY